MYQIGKSPEPLQVSEIERNIVIENPELAGENNSYKYVYEIEKFVFPISFSNSTPADLLFTSNDFLKANSLNSNEYHVEIGDEFKAKLKHKIFVYYNSNFYYKDKDDVRREINEKDLDVKVKKYSDEKNCPVIEIIFDNNKAMVYNSKANHIKVLINNIGSITKDLIDEGTFNIRFYYRTISSIDEKKIDIFTENENKVTRKESSQYKVIKIRKMILSSGNYKPTYVDATYTKIPKKQQKPKRKPSRKYNLNLRGLLYFVSLCNRKISRDVDNLNEIIDNICNRDKYTDLTEEIDMKCFGFKIERLREGKWVKEQKKSEPSRLLYKPKIKGKFPFLSNYNYYKTGLPENFMVDFLFNTVSHLKDTLRSKGIYDLKYEVTEKYLTYVRNSLHDPLLPRIKYLAMNKEEFNSLKKFEDEITVYINGVKDTKRQIEIDNDQFMGIQDAKVQFERKLDTLVKSDEPVISIKSILPRNNRGTISTTGVEISVIEKFCKYGTEESESYSCINSYMLIKNKLLREIYEHLTKSNFNNDLKAELKKNGIPQICLIGIEAWVRNYEDFKFSENFNRLIKIVNQYPKYQTYMTSFQFETSVFDKFFCNRLFSYFI